MFKKILLITLILVAFGPAVSLAVNVGDIRVLSSLNQRLLANIDLNTAGVSSTEHIKVNIASAADFAKVNLERPFVLTKIKITIKDTGPNQAVIVLASRNLIREAFLSFLLEINWPKGRILRKFTVLLDPAPEPSAAEEPLIANPGPVLNQTTAPPPNLQTNPVVPAPKVTGKYITVRRGSTLLGIAHNVKKAGANINQVMRELFINNPQAFVGGNINRLRSGVNLLVPDSDIMAVRAATPGPDSVQNPSNPNTRNSNAADRLQLADSNTTQAGANANSSDQNNTDLMRVQEASEANRRETENLRNRIAELETILSNVSEQLKTITTQRDKLQADAQTAQLAQNKPPASVTPQQPVVAPVEQVAVVNPEPVRPVHPENTTAPNPNRPSAAKPQVPQVPVVIKPPPAEPNFWTDFDFIFNWPSFNLPTSLPTIDEFLSNTTYKIALGGLVVFILGGVGLWLWLKQRKNVIYFDADSQLVHPEDDVVDPHANSSTVIDSSIIDGHDQPTVNDRTGGDETSFVISEFPPTGMTTQSTTGEVEPEHEVDVYIAYGQYHQAERLIKDTLEKNPANISLKCKLLDIYFAMRNAEAYVKLIEELHASGMQQKEPSVWNRICSMGRDLAPDHPLMQGSDLHTEPRGGRINTSQRLSSEEDLAQETVLSEMQPEPGSGNRYTPSPDVTVATAPRSKDIEVEELFDKDEDVVNVPSIALSSEPIDLGPVAEDATSKGSHPGQDLAHDQIGIDLSSELGELGDLHNIDSIPMPEDVLDSEALDEYLSSDSLSVSGNDDSIGLDSSDIDASALGALENSKYDFNLDSITPDSDISMNSIPIEELIAVDSVNSQDSQADSGQINIEGGDTIGTNLDLARAYIDMGITDEETKRLLEEVIQKGNAKQQGEAKALLAQCA
ncbi:hypothetical protein TI04_02015 [Achromatium sp. WMS2]|nr:hypothetical protein TI04_02015 [Achromatium sp. WMS2]